MDIEFLSRWMCESELCWGQMRYDGIIFHKVWWAGFLSQLLETFSCGYEHI